MQIHSNNLLLLGPRIIDMKISVELNLTQTDFLDATLNLNTGKFWPYRISNDNPLHINKNSNHSPSIKNKFYDRLIQFSSSENEFDRAAPIYNKALQENVYEIYLKYWKEAKATKTINNRKRRNIVWFNPPYSENVQTNIGHEFLNPITKHFPKHNRLHKICNKNNINISYSCMPNMSTVILGHNKKLLSTLPKADRPTIADPKCNCRIKTACPLNGECKQKSIVYKQKYPLTIPPNYIMDPILLISKRDFVITNIHLPNVIKETQPSYQKKFCEQKIMVLSRL